MWAKDGRNVVFRVASKYFLMSDFFDSTQVFVKFIDKVLKITYCNKG